MEKSDKKYGNFSAFLWFRGCSGAENLRRHVINYERSVTYISPKVQNEIVQTCSNLEADKVVTNINKSDCFAILADETMDILRTEQLSLYRFKKWCTCHPRRFCKVCINIYPNGRQCYKSYFRKMQKSGIRYTNPYILII